METKLTEEKINSMPEELLRQKFLIQQEAYDNLQKQYDVLLSIIDELRLQIKMLTDKTYGRKTDKVEITSEQLSLFSDNANLLNEAESETKDGMPEEPETETVTYTRRKSK